MWALKLLCQQQKIMTNEVLERLQIFIEKERWRYKFPLTNDVRLYEDLGIYGDDAVDFIVAFGKEFNVDVSNFLAADYFKGEGIDIITPILNLFKSKHLIVNKKSLTLGHLEKSIKAGRLDEEIINS
jgi:hypothetical protein